MKNDHLKWALTTWHLTKSNSVDCFGCHRSDQKNNGGIFGLCNRTHTERD